MATSFGALCTDFYVNQKLSVKTQLPTERATVMHLFDRIRAACPSMNRLKRYRDELSLESPRREGQYQWFAMSQRYLRAGIINPDHLDQAYDLHKLVLEITPYFLTLSPLEIDNLELSFGFDLQCKANHNEIVRQALIPDSPLTAFIDLPNARPIDVQPVIGISLSEDNRTHAFIEVKNRSSLSEIRHNRFRSEPISVFLTVRRLGTMDSLEQMITVFNELREYCEQLAHDQVIPYWISPLNRAIINNNA